MAKQQKFTFKIPSGYYSKDRRNEIAEAIKNEVVKRTKAGRDKNNELFAKYTKEYAKEKGQRRRDLTLSDDMLSNLKVLKVGTTNITIGYEQDYDGMGKVEGNVLGTYGQSQPIEGKSRDFLGISQGDLERVLRRFPFTPTERRKQNISDALDKEIEGLSEKAKEKLFRSKPVRNEFQEELRDKNE